MFFYLKLEINMNDLLAKISDIVWLYLNYKEWFLLLLLNEIVSEHKK